MLTMFFDRYERHTNKSVNPALFWEYDLADFDFNAMRTVVVQRVVERGWPRDWYTILNMYSLKGVRQAIKDIPYLNEKDMQFASLIFDIPFNDMKYFKKTVDASMLKLLMMLMRDKQLDDFISVGGTALAL